MSGLPRKVKKALGKWADGVRLGKREGKRVQALFSRTGVAVQIGRDTPPSTTERV